MYWLEIGCQEGVINMRLRKTISKIVRLHSYDNKAYLNYLCMGDGTFFAREGEYIYSLNQISIGTNKNIR